MAESAVSFGRPMREKNFGFNPTYTPLNHGSYGTFPNVIKDYMRKLQDLAAAQPDTFIRYSLPELLIKSREAVAPLLGVDTNEVVFVPNATTGINTVLRNIEFARGDVILYFNTIYGACEKTVRSICETSLAESVCIELQYPVEDETVVQKFCDVVEKVKLGGRTVKMAMFDTVLTFPGVRMPWEALVGACKRLSVLSLIDGAHGIGHIDLTKLGGVGPDFFTSNCYKWLYTPRGCAILYVPYRNQHLIRTTLPTSHGFRPLPNDGIKKSPTSKSEVTTAFVELFAFVATVDTSPYMVVPKALEFRQRVCGGEASIREYCHRIAQVGGAKVAKTLGTEVMDNSTRTLQQCCFANVRLPLDFGTKGTLGKTDRFIDVAEAPHLVRWIMERAVKDFATYLPTKFHAEALWVRLSGQIYLEEKDFEWAGHVLKGLCERIIKGEGRAETVN